MKKIIFILTGLWAFGFILIAELGIFFSKNTLIEGDIWMKLIFGWLILALGGTMLFCIYKIFYND